MVDITRIGALLVFSTLLGCSDYLGDGELIDHGIIDAKYRYKLDLGYITLGDNAEYRYTASNLPIDTFVFGLQISSKDVIESPLPINANIALTITDSGGEKIIEENAPIGDWVWTIVRESTSTFVYRREDVGTYLSVDPDEKYSIYLAITNADESGSDYEAIFIGQTGGWK